MALQKKSARKTPTWTFQPDSDVLLMVEKVLGPDAGRGEKTRLANEALRGRVATVALALAEQDAAAKRTQLDQLRLLADEEKRTPAGQGMPRTIAVVDSGRTSSKPAVSGKLLRKASSAEIGKGKQNPSEG